MAKSACFEEKSDDEGCEEIIPDSELRNAYEDLMINTHNLACKFKNMNICKVP